MRESFSVDKMKSKIAFLSVCCIAGMVSLDTAFAVPPVGPGKAVEGNSLLERVAQSHKPGSGRPTHHPASSRKGDDVGRPHRPDRPRRPHRPKPGWNLQLVIPPGAFDDDRPRRRTQSPQKKIRPARRALPAPVRISDDRYRRDEVVVVIRQKKNQSFHRAIARRFNLRLLQGRDYSLLNGRVQAYRIPDKRSVGTVLAQLKADRRIRASQPNFIYQVNGNESGADREVQYARSSMNVDKAQEFASGKGIRIAVIDTGIDKKHPEFRDAVIQQYNAVEENKPYDGHKHGTAIAGILAAQNEIKGIAPRAHILDARAFFINEKSGEPETTSMILLNALQWSYEQGAQIFNLSFEGPQDPVIEDAIEAIHEKGRVLVAAAGNGGPKARPAYPAAYSHVIATTAVDKSRNIYEQANRGKYLTLSAPGVRVMVLSTSNSYSFQSGTSIAAAHISGVVALMMERKSGISAQEIRKVITKTAVDLGKPGHDNDYGAGLADAHLSLQALSGSSSGASLVKTRQ